MQLNGFKYFAMKHEQFHLTSVIFLHIVKWLNSSSWSIDGMRAGITTPGKIGPRSNGNEEVLYFPQSSRTGASPSCSSVLYPGHLWKQSYSCYRGAVDIFYSPSQLGGVGNKGVHTFPKDINLKMSLIEQMKFELTHFETTVQQFNHYTIEIPSLYNIKYEWSNNKWKLFWSIWLILWSTFYDDKS